MRVARDFVMNCTQLKSHNPFRAVENIVEQCFSAHIILFNVVINDFHHCYT